MNLVTGNTIACCHFFAVRRMAFHAVRDPAMSVTMTSGTGHGGMMTRVFLQLGNLVCMTGQTWISQIVRQCDIEWCMWVGMTGEAVF